MGKVKFSAAISEIRNKVGGVIYARNRYGAYVRNYSFPNLILHPLTSIQIAAETSFGTVSATWKTLTNSQRTAWQNSANMVKQTDIFGSQYNSNGFQFFMKLNVDRVLTGGSIMANPPTLAPIPLFGGLTVSFDASMSEFNFDLTNSDLTSSHAVVIRCTRSQSQGAKAFKNLYTIVKVVNDATTLPYNAYNDYISVLGGFSNNTRVGYQVYIIDKTTGIRSQGLSGYIDITTPYEAGAQAYFDQVIINGGAALTNGWKTKINNWFVSASANGYLTELVRFHSLYNENEIAAQTSFINPSQAMCVYEGAAAFVPFTYFASNGSTAYIRSQFIPSTDGGGIHTLNSAFYGLGLSGNSISSGVDSAVYSVGGNSQSVTAYPSFGWLQAVNDDASNIIRSNASSLDADYILIRTSSTNVDAYKDNSMTSGTKTSTGLPNLEYYFGGANNAGVLASQKAVNFKWYAFGSKNIVVATFRTDLIALFA